MKEYFDSSSDGMSRNLETVLENLAQSDSELEKKGAKRELYLRELAGLISRAESAEALEIFNTFTEAFENGEGRVKSTLELQSVARLCEFVAMLSQGQEAEPKARQGSRMCYFRNVFSDLAYLSFASVLKDASADYTHDFNSACEEVYNGNYDYCILPFASYTDGLLSRFIAIMQKYELKIAMSCRVNTPSDEFMDFYLLGAGLTRQKDADRMALVLLPESGQPLWQSLASLEMMGASALGCISLPMRMYEESAYFAEFDITGANVDAIIKYIELAMPDSFISGIYRHII